MKLREISPTEKFTFHLLVLVGRVSTVPLPSTAIAATDNAHATKIAAITSPLEASATTPGGLDKLQPASTTTGKDQ